VFREVREIVECYGYLEESGFRLRISEFKTEQVLRQDQSMRILRAILEASVESGFLWETSTMHYQCMVRVKLVRSMLMNTLIFELAHTPTHQEMLQVTREDSGVGVGEDRDNQITKYYGVGVRGSRVDGS
jgi:hypothetical protein